jgi:hypothetical protein
MAATELRKDLLLMSTRLANCFATISLCLLNYVTNLDKASAAQTDLSLLCSSHDDWKVYINFSQNTIIVNTVVVMQLSYNSEWYEGTSTLSSKNKYLCDPQVCDQKSNYISINRLNGVFKFETYYTSPQLRDAGKVAMGVGSPVGGKCTKSTSSFEPHQKF